MQIGINGVQYVNEFPPHVSRDLCIKYKLTSESKVLDPCAGWGGRMLGCSTQINSYTAFEPSTKTYEGLKKQVEFIHRFRPEFSPTLHCMPYEDSEVLEDHYDFALTSPPYYDTELYSEEETNSCVRYKTYADWRDNFYYPMIMNTLTQIKIGSSFVLNIGSRKYPLNKSLRELVHGDHRFQINKMDSMLSCSTGLGKSGEGEAFYEIKKLRSHND